MTYGGETMIKSAVKALRQVGSSFKLEPFGTIIQQEGTLMTCDLIHQEAPAFLTAFPFP
jgi:uncharacterized protein YqgV (UPF0045/DUF77 family)